MKKYILILIISLIYNDIIAQGITKNSKGESSILFRGNNIALDIGESELSFGLNNLQRSIGRKNAFIWGTNVKAKNESGVAGLFSKGDFVPSSTISGFAGYSISNGIPDGIQNDYQSNINTYNNFLKNADSSFTSLIKNAIENKLRDEVFSDLKETLLNRLKSSRTQEQFINYVASLSPEKENEKNALKDLLEVLRSLLSKYKEELDTYESKINKIETNLHVLNYWQATFFGFGGIRASEFKYFKGIDSTNLSSSFSDQYFRGGHIGLGANFQYGRFMVGLTYSYLKTDNFNLLSKSDFTLRTNTTINNQTISQEKKIVGYSGSYGSVEVNEFLFDFMWREKLDVDGKNNILINPYIRSQLFSRNSELLPNSTNIGTGFYFFQQSGKFLGGIYIELPDVNQNYEKAKPVQEQSFRKPLQRLSFGIVGRISIGSIVNLF